MIDRAARWKTSVRAVEEPGVVTHPGYVRVTIDVAQVRPVDCFVYDVPIVTGQALSRLVSAAEIGIDYERFVVEYVDALEQTPIVGVRADYRDEEKGTPGRLFIAVAPRVKQPVVCSHEGTKTSAPLREVMENFVRGLEPESSFASDSLASGEELLSFELWGMYRGENPIGFRETRAARRADGEVTTLEISATFEPDEKGLRTTDVRVSERSDVSGLVVAEWLELENGELHARAALERAGQGDSEEFTYRLAGLGPAGPVEKEMRSSDPVRSDYFAMGEIERSQAAEEVTEFFRYIPSLSLEQPTELRHVPGPKGGTKSSRLHVGQAVYELHWDDEGRIARRSMAEAGDELRLLSRLLGAD